MCKNFDSPSRDYIIAWLEAERQLAIMGYCNSVKRKNGFCKAYYPPDDGPYDITQKGSLEEMLKELSEKLKELL